MDYSAFFENPAIAQIPVDLFLSRKRLGFTRGDLIFSDSSGNLVFSVDDRPTNLDSRTTRVLLGSGGTPLISISRENDGWLGYRGDSRERKNLIFKTERRRQSHWRKEVDVFLVGEDSGGSNWDFKIIGSPFQRSCTIYQGNSVVAQTSLLYKLRQVLVGRQRFRLTIFPGFADHTLVAALVLVFFGGRI